MRRSAWSAGVLAVACGLSADALTLSRDCATWVDPRGDAVIRRTDPGNDGPIMPGATLPDVVRVSLCAWQPTDPVADPYTGNTVDPDDSHLFKLDLVFAGVVNPPGPLGFYGQPYDPFRHGPSPVIGYLDIDVDSKNTGGELGSAARSRYLANVARFGRLPYGSISERVATSAFDYDWNFGTPPQYERTGADFALVFCGCWGLTVVSEGGNGNGVFDEGESWIVRGRLFQRTNGYQEASSAWGGSGFGTYDPYVNVRFSHDTHTDETTITLVFALDMTGAAMLTGQPEQPINYNVGDHVSIVEALSDVIDGADAGGLSEPVWELIKGWKGRDPFDYLDPTEWAVSALFGMPYAEQQAGATFVWTDSGMGECLGDLNANGYATAADKTLLREAVYDLDGGAQDADGMVNGRVVIVDPGPNFSLYDLNGDTVVNLDDFRVYGKPADFDGNGVVNTLDFIAFLNAWVAGDPAADFDLNQVVNTLDFIAFLNEWVQG